MSVLENLFKYHTIYSGRASSKNAILGTIPSNSRFIIIYSINYADDNNYYYFMPIIMRTEFVRDRAIAFPIGLTSDTREILLEFKNNIIKIIHSSTTNSTADNNYISKILSINY